MAMITCPECGKEVSDKAEVCPNCGCPINKKEERRQPAPVEVDNRAKYTSIFKKKQSGLAIAAFILSFFGPLALVGLIMGIVDLVKKDDTKKHGFAIAAIIISGLMLIALYGTSDSKTKTNSASKTSQTIAEESTTEKSDVAEEKTKVQEIVEEVEEKVEQLSEINPDIPLGTTYELGQGNYVVGDDIPAGRYMVTYVDGNQFGGYLQGKGKYVGSAVSIDPDLGYCCILQDGDSFELELITCKFEKISSIPNDAFLQSDGSYKLTNGYYFEGIDIPCGKYNVTAVDGNQFGLYVSTKQNAMLALDIGETYNNLSLQDEGSTIEISLGTVSFEPKN